MAAPETPDPLGGLPIGGDLHHRGIHGLIVHGAHAVSLLRGFIAQLIGVDVRNVLALGRNLICQSLIIARYGLGT